MPIKSITNTYTLYKLMKQVSIGLAVVCLPVLRRMHPEWERPIRVHMIFPILYTLGTIFIIIVPMVASPVETGKGIGIILTGVPVYFIFVYWKNKPKIIKSLLDSFTKICQKLINVRPKENGNGKK